MDDDQLQYLIFAVGTNIYLVACLAYFFYNSGKSDAIRQRLPPFVLLCWIANCACANFYLTGIFPSVFDRMPLFAIHWLAYLSIPTWMASNLLRDIYVIFSYHLQNAKFSNGGDERFFKGLGRIDRFVLVFCVRLQGLTKRKVADRKDPQSPKLSVISSIPSDSKHIISTTSSVSDKPVEASSDRASLMTKLSNFKSKDLFLVIYVHLLFFIIVGIIMNILCPEISYIPIGYPPLKTKLSEIPMYLVCFTFFVVKPILLYSQRNLKDCVGLRLESKIYFFVLLLGFGLYLFELRPFNRHPYSWLYGICIIFGFVLTVFPRLYELVEGRNLTRPAKFDQETFSRVLKDPKEYKELREIMVAMFCIENSLFLEDYAKFLNEIQTLKLKNNADGVIKGKLRLIHQKFLVPGSPCELNLPDELISRVNKDYLEFVKASDANMLEKMIENFNMVQKEVYGMIFSNCFPRYLKRHKQ